MSEIEGIIQVKRLEGEPTLVSPAILVAFPYLLKKLLSFKELSVHNFRDGIVEKMWHRPLPNGSSLGILGPVLGAPQAALVLEKICALGAREAIVIGCCGAVSEELAIGDILVPDCALSEDGVSRIYCGEQLVFLPDDEMVARLEGYLKRYKLCYKMGALLSTDAVLRETRTKMDAYKRLGIKGVDMEVASLFCVGVKKGIRVAAVLAVSDELYGRSWRPGFKSPPFKEICLDLTKAIYEGVMEDALNEA
ncbi:MAG: hypothetical protein ACK4WB_09100 [Desulfatiglandales bacterium]